MRASFAVESDLWHDGDGLVRYGLRLENGSFSASTLAWGNDHEHLTFAATLAGFPATPTSDFRFRFGTSGTGTCDLHFFCMDGSGHLGLWAHFEAENSTGRPEEHRNHERASLFMQCDPASIDSFVACLRGFVAGSPNRAELAWLGP